MSIKVRTSDFRTLTRSRTLPTPTDVGREIFLVARELLAGVDLGGLPVRLVGVRTEGLSPAGTTPRQPTLEEAMGEDGAARRDAERVMDLVRDKFGRRGRSSRVPSPARVTQSPCSSTTADRPAIYPEP